MLNQIDRLPSASRLDCLEPLQNHNLHREELSERNNGRTNEKTWING